MAITTTQAQGLLIALFGASAGGHLTSLAAAPNMNTLAGDLSTSVGLILGKDLSSNTAFRSHVTANLKLTGDVLTAVDAWIDGQLNAGAARGDIVATAVTFLSTLTDTTSLLYASAQAFQATVTAAVAWSTGAGATQFGVTALRANQGNVEVVAGSSFVLTTAANTVTGTVGADDTITATNLTLLAGDVIVDPSTTDNDTMTVNLTAAPATQATVANIENIVYNVSSFAAVTLDATGITGAKNITVNNLQLAGNNAATVNAVASGTTVNAGSGVTGTLTVAQAGASSVNVNGGTATTVTVTGGTTGATVVAGGTATATATAVATTGSVTMSGAALTSATATGATTNVTLTAAGVTATPTTVAITGNGAADVATVSANGIVTLTNAANIETTNLSGNTAAVTYNAAGVFGALNLTGAQSVTVAGASSLFTGKTITDATTAGTTTIKLTNTVAAATNLSKIATDVIEQSAVLNAAATFNFASGANFDVTGTQTSVITLATSAVTATTGVATDSINVNAKGATAVLITSDSTTAATETAFNTVNFSNTVANTTLTAILGATTGALNISGSKQVTLATTTTAKTVDASTLTGALIATADAATTADIKGGSGNDVITTATGAVVKLDGGTGSNTVKVVGDMDSVTFTNFAVVEATGNVTDAKVSQFDGASFVLTGTTAGTTFTFGTTAANFDKTTVDLSKLVTNNIASFAVNATIGLSTALFTSNTAITVNGSALDDTLTGTANGDSLTGNAGNDTLNGLAGADTINGGAGADIIDGDAGADVITAGEGADTITGGTGIDTIDLTETTAAVDNLLFTAAGFTSANADVVTGFAAGTGIDTITIDDALNGVTALTIGARIASGASTAIDLTAIQTAANTDAPVYYIQNSNSLSTTQIETAITAGTAATGETYILVDNGTNTLVYFDAAAETDAGNGAGMILLVTLMGVTGATALVTGDLVSA